MTYVPVAPQSISVVVCCYSTARWGSILVATAATLAQLDRATDRLVLVVDHNDELFERARAELPEVTVITNSGQPGLSGARNCGVAETDSEIVAFLDDDAVPEDGWIDGIRRAFDDTDLAMAGGTVTPVWPDRGRPTWFPHEFDWVVGCDYRGMPAVGGAIRNPIGANMAVRRADFDAAGPFRSDLGRYRASPAGCEETEFAVRLRRMVPSAVIARIVDTPVAHHIDPYRCTRRYFIDRCVHEGRSKAAMATVVGSTAPLDAERRYATRTLPSGVIRELLPTPRSGGYHPSRAWWIGIGLTATTFGWVSARWGAGRRISPTIDVEPDGAFVPIPIVELELSALPHDDNFPAPNSSGRLRILTLLLGSPLGVLDLKHLAVETDSRAGRANAEAFLAAVAASYDSVIAQTLRLLPPLRDSAAPDRPTVSSVAQLLAAPHLLSNNANPRFGRSVSGRITVAVCSIGRSDRLFRTVEALLAQSYPSITVLVVDNDPASGSVRRILGNIDAENLIMIEEPQRGVSHARNAGLRFCRDELIAFTDDDVIPDRRWVERLVDIFTNDDAERIGCVTGLVLAAEFRVQEQEWFEQSSGFERGYNTLVWDTLAPTATGAASTASPDPLERVGGRGPAFPYTGSEFGSGNNMAFRTGLLRDAGGFDTLLGTGSPARGGEDLDIFRRVILGGAAIVYNPAAMVWHYHRSDYRALRAQMYDYGVGMSANLFRHMVRGPRETAQILAALPVGIRVLVDPASVKNRGRTSEHPRELTVLELAGYLTGPAHMVWSAYCARRSRFLGDRERSMP